MKILLIQPPKPPLSIGGEELHFFEPLSLEYVGAGVIDDHDVRIHDMRIDEDLPGVLKSFKPQMVGLTALTVHVNVVKELLKEIKVQLPNVTTVVGGHHATVAPMDFQCPQVDLIVSGEAVFTFKELVRRIEAQESLADLAGVAYRDENGVFQSTPHDVYVPLDSLPMPARELTAQHRGKYFSQWMKPMAAVVTSKGCPFRCNYCVIWKLTGGKRQTREPKKIVAELLTLEEEWIFFADYESLVDVERMYELARLIKEAGIKKRYTLYSRADTIVDHPKLIEAWREIGLNMVIVGFEFFRDEDLAQVNKGSTIAQNEQAITVLNELGINIAPYFMVRQEFDREDFAQLRAYLKRLALPFASIFILTPLPGTDLYEERKDEFISDKYDFFDFFHTILPTKLPLKDFYEEVYQTWKAPTSFFNALKLASNFRLRDLPAATMRVKRSLEKVRKAHLDH